MGGEGELTAEAAQCLVASIVRAAIGLGYGELATVLAPGYRVATVENEQMLGAFKFFRMEPRTLYLSATATPAGNGDLIARVVLRSPFA
jgi:hypothetical protein